MTPWWVSLFCHDKARRQGDASSWPTEAIVPHLRMCKRSHLLIRALSSPSEWQACASSLCPGDQLDLTPALGIWVCLPTTGNKPRHIFSRESYADQLFRRLFLKSPGKWPQYFTANSDGNGSRYSLNFSWFNLHLFIRLWFLEGVGEIACLF